MQSALQRLIYIHTFAPGAFRLQLKAVQMEQIIDDSSHIKPIENYEVGSINHPSANPVLDIPLMRMSGQDFEDCRIAPDGRISIYDAIRKIMAPAIRKPKKYFMEIVLKSRGPFLGASAFAEHSETSFMQHVTYVQFPGERQNPTPVCHFNTLLVICHFSLVKMRQHYEVNRQT